MWILREVLPSWELWSVLELRVCREAASCLAAVCITWRTQVGMGCDIIHFAPAHMYPPLPLPELNIKGCLTPTFCFHFIAQAQDLRCAWTFSVH